MDEQKIICIPFYNSHNTLASVLTKSAINDILDFICIFLYKT